MRFDEVELDVIPNEIEGSPVNDPPAFAALALALLPLLQPNHWPSLAALAGFVIIVSFHYFVGTWLLWGKTIGGAIFDVRVVSNSSEAMAFNNATKRWIALYLSLLTLGIGFLFSLPDRMSGTRSVAAV